MGWKRIGLLFAALLALPRLAEGQCRKHILVYLDISGSMQPRSQSSSSPYQQTLAAVEALFRQTGFIEPNDAVTVVRFGDTVRQVDTAEGPNPVLELIQRLKANTESSNETDFRAAFDHIATALPEGVFNRKLVLFASDFVHESRSVLDAYARERSSRSGQKRALSDFAIPDWQAAFTKGKEDLGDLFTPEKKTVPVLFRVRVGSEDRRKIAKTVLAELRSGFRVTSEAESGADVSAAVADLTFELRKSLLDPPSLQVSRDAGNTAQLKFKITNLNCYPLHLTRLSLKPKGPGEPVFFAVGAEDREIGSTLDAEAREKTLGFTAPPGEEWQSAELTATVETEEGVLGTTEGTTGSWLKFRTVAAVFERRLLLADILRLDLELTGYTSPSVLTTYQLTMGESSRPLARARIEAPEFEDLAGHPFRLVVPMKTAGREAEDVLVAIESAEASAPGAERVDLTEDRRATHTNYAVFGAAVLALVALVCGFVLVRMTVSDWPVFGLTRQGRVRWAWMLVLVLVAIAILLLRVSLLKVLSARNADLSSTIVVAATLLFFVFPLTLAVLRARFARLVVARKEVLTRERYLRRSRIGAGAPWVIGLLLAGIFCFVCWQLAPSATQESRRSEHPPQLEARPN